MGHSFIHTYFSAVETKITVEPMSFKLAEDENPDDVKAVHFECEAKSDDSTPVMIHWYKDDARIYPDLDERISVDSHNTLTLNIEVSEDLYIYIYIYDNVNLPHDLIKLQNE